MRKTTVFLIRHNRILRDGIKAIINKQADLKVVAASTGNHDTLEQAQTLKPDVVLIDLGLGNINGLQVVATLTKKLPQTKVIGMGLIPSQADIVEFVQAAAAGFILMEASIRISTLSQIVPRGLEARLAAVRFAQSKFTKVTPSVLGLPEPSLN